MTTFDHDDCCGAKLAAALLADAKTMNVVRVWTCPECETEWRGELHKLDQGTGTIHWTPYVYVELFKTGSAGA